MGRKYKSAFKKYYPQAQDREVKKSKEQGYARERTDSKDWIVVWEARNSGQRDMLELYHKHDLVMAIGVAGCGKTHCALALALNEVRKGHKECVYVVRPVVGATERGLGFLKGGLEEKLEPYALPVRMLVDKVALGVPDGVVRVFSLEHARGVTFENCVVLVDEAQNLTLREFKLLISRVGENCRMVFTGDPEQVDVRGTCEDWETDLDYVVECLWDKAGVAVVEFDEREIVRHPRMHGWLKALGGGKKK